MNSKIFSVTVTQCADSSHADKIAELLRKNFPHRRIRVDADKPSQPSVGGKVQGESPAAILAVLAPALGAAKCFCGEVSFLEASGKLSPVPPNYMKFEPPVKN